MGWKGEGYGMGKNQQGILKPIEIDVNNARLGLGFLNFRFNDGYDEELVQMDIELDSQTDAKEDFNSIKSLRNNRRHFKANVNNLLNKFVTSSMNIDLVFDSDLTKDERKLIHTDASRLGLKTHSEGSGAGRFIVVSKHITSSHLLSNILNSGGQISEYELISKGTIFK
jgi:hypothetical protein